MSDSIRDRAIALSGIFHAVSVVDKLAKTGYLETERFETSIQSLFEREPDSAEAVFGGLSKLETGIERLVSVLKDQRADDNRDALRYGLGAILLQKKLAKRSSMLQSIAERLDAATTQLDHFGLTHDNLIGNIADIYTDHISTFKYRIHVSGEYHYLQQARVANQVRGLLLAAIRAATLWRQCGGSRLDFFLKRKSLLQTSEALLEEARQSLRYH